MRRCIFGVQGVGDVVVRLYVDAASASVSSFERELLLQSREEGGAVFTNLIYLYNVFLTVQSERTV